MDVVRLLFVCLFLTFVSLARETENRTSATYGKRNAESKQHGEGIENYDEDSGNLSGRSRIDVLAKTGKNVQEPTKHHGLTKRSAIRESQYRWTNKEVPFFFSMTFNGSKENIEWGMNNLEYYTCVQFRQDRFTDQNRLTIKGIGCEGYTGMLGGDQDLFLGPTCRYKRDVLRHLSITLGLIPEVRRPDRDRFVTVYSGNIIAPNLGRFKKYNVNAINTYGIPYDYKSITHPHPQEFGLNDKWTFEPKDSAYRYIVGRTVQLSFRNIKLLNLMYECDDTCSSKPACPGEGFVGKDCRCWCPGSPVIACENDPDSTAVCPDEIVTKHGSSGVIYSPGFQMRTSYPHLSVCKWKIEANNTDDVIRLEITKFETEFRYDYLTLYDGPNTSYPLLANLSGILSNQFHSSTQSKMFLQFIADYSSTRRGFSIHYTAGLSHACSGGVKVIRGTTGNISSPGFSSGHNYSHNAVCQWLITPRNFTGIIRLQIEQFYTEIEHDYLAVYDGAGPNDRLAYISGLISRRVYSSSEPQMFLKFTSDGSVSRQGFYLQFYSIIGPVCPNGLVRLNHTSGNIYSPGYLTAQMYTTLESCQWLITALPPSIIGLEVTRFDTEGCCDFLNLYDGPGKTARRLASLSGNITKRYFYTSGSKMFLSFTSDGSVSRSGFALRYTMLTDRIIECTFESNCDDLELSQQNSYRWYAARSTSTPDTGPSGDHTYDDGRGKFLYAEASSGHQNDETDAIISPPLVASAPFYCVTFWYHMFGLDVGGLWVNYSILHPSHNMTILWRQGSQGKHWVKEEEDLDIQIGKPFTIIFRVWKGQGERGDIAIDDLSLRPGRCQQGIWGDWSPWSCSVTCDTGTGSRYRNCSSGRCQGSGLQTKLCDEGDCPAKWGPWSSWTLCPVTCDSGISKRHRTCQGNNCTGVSTEVRICTLPPCQGTWGPWFAWSGCSVSCGSGIAQRNRDCQDYSCYGNSTEERICRRPACQGNWTAWTAWSCDVTCGYGVRRRSRRCLPSSASCSGPRQQTNICEGPASC